jgi:hypothetical protein
MRFILSAIIAFFILCSSAQAQIACPKYTEEQLERIQAAYNFGATYGYGLTLPAIVIRESFVGDRIVRYNHSDPSVGITHIQFQTLKSLSGLNQYETNNEAARVIRSDFLAFYYAILKLESIKSKSYWYKWKRYNGDGHKAIKYAHKIKVLTIQLEFCQRLSASQGEGLKK